ncbi:DUF6265 family protein [Sphingomonas baiyangensis]|uniref:DUF6265 domain-containing protein n=1 Tax=Sphingomonas baiyangensis TaxID=2572576 RepID=A0A4U1L421_9SPHN|nr:DUF6265 family protein [Sphingomonas baiyangensis]TKD50990.1 hypothetical protein FBR43_09630 [Sphingomonas baiyangensis]
MLVPLLAALLAQSAPGSALPAQTRTLAPGEQPMRATLADMAWIAGEWRGTSASGEAGESYSAPAGGQITGHFYEMRDGRVTLMELSQIIERDGGVVLRYRHFNPDFTGWEDGTRKPVEFRLIAIEGQRYYFDGATLDRTRPGGLDFWVRIDGAGKQPREIVYRYDRVR